MRRDASAHRGIALLPGGQLFFRLCVEVFQSVLGRARELLLCGARSTQREKNVKPSPPFINYFTVCTYQVTSKYERPRTDLSHIDPFREI